MEKLWNRTLEVLKDKVEQKSFHAWIKPLEQAQANQNFLRLIAPNKTIRKWFTNHYLKQATETLRELSGRDMTIEVDIADSQMTFDKKVIQAPAPTTKIQKAKKTNSNNNYTFDNFVVGPSNEFAFAACRNVAKKPGHGMNPLFIYGGTGLGKTHLLNALAGQLVTHHEDYKLALVSAERFMNELIGAIQTRRTAAFHRKYRNLDALMIDDIQTIAGKNATQEEFFHTFNTLYENDAQIVLASDKCPKDILGLEERLCSRFGMGMLADIQTPELETRIAIVKKKAASEKLNVPEDVIFYIAAHIKENIRELEGALRRVAAFSKLHEGRISLNLAKRALRNVIGDPDRPISIENIQKAVCDFYRVKHQDLVGNRRHKAIARPRQVAMFLARKMTAASLPDIAEKFGNRDHTTVLHAVRKMTSLSMEDAQLTTILETLEKTLRA